MTFLFTAEKVKSKHRQGCYGNLIIATSSAEQPYLYLPYKAVVYDG